VPAAIRIPVEPLLSLALWLELFLDKTLENFLLGHMHTLSDLGVIPTK